MHVLDRIDDRTWNCTVEILEIAAMSVLLLSTLVMAATAAIVLQEGVALWMLS